MGSRTKPILEWMEKLDKKNEELSKSFPTLYITLNMQPPDYTDVRVFVRNKYAPDVPTVFDVLLEHDEKRDQFPSDFLIAKMMLLT